MGCNRVPWIDPSDLAQRAAEFRERHGATRVPVPIDHIVEFDLDLHVAPISGLYQIARTSGYLTYDCSTIVVDRHCFDDLEPTYRYTLAHELSHIELHRDFWSDLSIRTPSEYIAAMESGMSEEEYQRQEWQASGFAGLVLVPAEDLAAQFGQQVEWACGIAHSGVPENADRQALYDIALEAVADRLGPHFNVHPLTVGIRIVRDGLAEQLGTRLLGDCKGIELRYRNPRGR